MAKAPDQDDRLVDVTAYITDEHFGYDHWRATQFRAGMPMPISDVQRPALLVVCADATERANLRARLEAEAERPALQEADPRALERLRAFERRAVLRTDLEEMFMAALRFLPDSPAEQSAEHFVLAAIVKALRDLGASKGKP